MTISIITPIYNADKYISNCIESILAQTYTDWELILVDDGSKDSSLSICEKFSKLDNRIKVVSQENSGPSAARNKGLEIARGEYICFVDADDWIEQNYLETYIKDSEKYDISFMGFTREDEHKNQIISFSQNINTNNISLKDFISKIYDENVFGWICCKMFQRNIIVINNIRFDETIRRREDALFTIDYLYFCKSARMIKSNGYHYYEHSESLIHEDSNPLLTIYQNEIIFKKLSNLVNLHLLEKLTTEFLTQYKFTMLMALMNKARYNCSYIKKRELIEKYFELQVVYPEIKQINTTKNIVNYHIMECILQTRCISLIINLLPIL